MPTRREEQQNSSCALFLAIIFVIMLFSNSHDERESRNSRYYGHYRTTPAPTMEMPGNATIMGPHHTLTEQQMQRNRESARVALLLLGSLMLMQLVGFCFVIGLRRRALRRQAEMELSGTSITRHHHAGWLASDSSDEDDFDHHPALGSLAAAHRAEVQEETEGLPSYEETIQPPPSDANSSVALDGLPTYIETMSKENETGENLRTEATVTSAEIESDSTSGSVQGESLGGTVVIDDNGDDSDASLVDDDDDETPLISAQSRSA